MRYVVGAIILYALWLLMSGVYKPVTMTLGALSCLTAVYVAARMNKTDNATLEYSLHPVRFFGYLAYLMKEIVLSNYAVAKVILRPKLSMSPRYINVPISQRSDIGKAVFANSITLTPGTLTVELREKDFAVSVLDYSDGDEEALADMDRRVTQKEWI